MAQKINLLHKKRYFLELWSKSRNGDKEAFRELADAHYFTLCKYATNFTKNKEVINDAIQDLFVRLWEHRHTIQIQVVTIYLIRSLRNYFLDRFRKNELLSITDLEEAEDVADDYNVENFLIQAEVTSQKEKKIQKAIDNLPKRQQEVIFLKFYQGFDHDKIAEIMNINRQSVANFLFKAVSALRIHLSKESS